MPAGICLQCRTWRDGDNISAFSVLHPITLDGQVSMVQMPCPSGDATQATSSQLSKSNSPEEFIQARFCPDSCMQGVHSTSG